MAVFDESDERAARGHRRGLARVWVGTNATGNVPLSVPRARAAAELREHLLCGWTVGPHSGGTETVLPDGSIDVVWLEGRAPLVAGPDTGPVPSARPPGSTVAGVSFRPGAAPAARLLAERYPLPTTA